MKKLPIAQTEIKHIIEENFCYVDKTKFIKELINDGHRYYFLSRPRRFGKSLLVDTMRAIFAGEKELFKGLYIEKNWDWEVKYPVITISFGGGTRRNVAQLNNGLNFILNRNAENYNIALKYTEIPDKFLELIIKLNEKYNQPVVILIDEYDKPILDNLTEPSVTEIRKELASFYSVLKDASKYIKLVFLTGVSKFSKTSIFSKLNNITDISLSEKYADICGYTQTDLETIFADYLHNVDLKKVKRWYNGYNFTGNSVYNPYDILMFLWNRKYIPHWFETGTPTFLLDLIKERKFYIPNLQNVSISSQQMKEFDIHNIDLEVLLYQTGYLTIKNVIQIGAETIYRLKIPNLEVKMGLTSYVFRMFYGAGSSSSQRTKLVEKIYFSLYDKKPQNLKEAFHSYFSDIPSDWYRKNNIAKYEGFYSAMFYTFFTGIGLDTYAEESTNKGQIDLAVKMETAIYVFEFKMKTNPKNALQQIKEKKYYEKYLSENKEIYLIGIEFDEELKNISNFEYEKFRKINT